jgi:hypothetical protein
MVAIIIWQQIQHQKWLEHMLKTQRESLTGIYNNQQALLTKMIEQMAERHEAMDRHIDELARQMALMAATLKESANLNDVIEELLARIQAKPNG